jgi:hypothetical protein
MVANYSGGRPIVGADLRPIVVSAFIMNDGVPFGENFSLPDVPGNISKSTSRARKN